MMPRATHVHMIRGDARAIPFEVEDTDISALTFTFQARYATSDVSPAISLRTATSGVVVINGAAGLGEVRIPPSATSSFTRITVLLWELQMDTPAGPETLLSGRLHVYPDITHD